MVAFGPVPSRRLGISLGINNIASPKACSYSCVYCQIGLTRILSGKRVAFYEPEVLFEDTKNHLKKLDASKFPDYLTFVANGEPTIDINLGTEIDLLKKLQIPIAVITNSSLLYDPQVREELMKADWISLKIDAIAEDKWKKINKPVPASNLEKMLSGIETFASQYRGDLHTETMMVADFNDDPKVYAQTASFIALLHPKTAYISIPTRPPAVKNIKPVSEDTIIGAWACYNRKGIHTELLSGFEGTDTGTTGNVIDDILNITAVHPLREDSMQALLKKSSAEQCAVTSLIAQGLIKKTVFDGYNFYIRNYRFK